MNFDQPLPEYCVFLTYQELLFMKEDVTGKPYFSNRHIAGNGSSIGDMCDGNFKMKDTYVSSYTKKDGVKIKSHYKATKKSPNYFIPIKKVNSLKEVLENIPSDIKFPNID